MSTVNHSAAAGIHPGAYVQSSDPGAVGAGILWIDTTGGSAPYPLKKRNSANTGWDTVSAPVLVGDSGSGGTAGLVPAPASGDAAAGKFLKASGAWATVTTSVGNLASASYTRTAGNYTTTSTTFVAVDATNLNFTITTGARRVLIALVGMVQNNTAPNNYTALDVAVDGTRLGGANGIVQYQVPTSNYQGNVSFTWITDALTAASHTFELMWLVSGGTGTLFGNTSGANVTPLRFAVVELYA